MSRLTFREIIAEVQRLPNLSRLSLGEITDKVSTAAKDIGNQPWPWNYAETNVLVPPPYSTGTISITNGTANVVGVGTVWDVTWYGRRMQFGTSSNLDYIVQSVNSPTSITLAQPINLSASLANSTYRIYQDTYLYPADYIIGSDVGLFQPTVRVRLAKIPRYKFENIMNQGLRSFMTNIQMFYCDQGEDLTTGTATSRLYRFRIGPPPSGPAELRLCYHQMAPDAIAVQIVTLPEGFDDVIKLTAASYLYDDHQMPGASNEVKLRAAGKMKLLRRAVATQTIDDIPDAMYEVPDSSISQWGLTISRM